MTDLFAAPIWSHMFDGPAQQVVDGLRVVTAVVGAWIATWSWRIGRGLHEFGAPAARRSGCRALAFVGASAVAGLQRLGWPAGLGQLLTIGALYYGFRYVVQVRAYEPWSTGPTRASLTRLQTWGRLRHRDAGGSAGTTPRGRNRD